MSSKGDKTQLNCKVKLLHHITAFPTHFEMSVWGDNVFNPQRAWWLDFILFLNINFPRIWAMSQNITTLCHKTNNGCLDIRFNYLSIIFKFWKKNDDTLIIHRLLLLFSRYMQTWWDFNSDGQSGPCIHQIIRMSNHEDTVFRNFKSISEMSYSLCLYTLFFIILENIRHVCIYQLHNGK